MKLLSGDKKISVTGKNLEDFLGAPYFQKEKAERGVGVVIELDTAGFVNYEGQQTCSRDDLPTVADLLLV